MALGRREQQLRSWGWWSWVRCQSQGVSASLHVCVQWALLSVPTPQQTKQEAPQAGDSPLPHPAVPYPFTPLWALQSGVSHGYRAAAPSPPGSMAFSMLQELGWILLSCRCAPRGVLQGGEAREAGVTQLSSRGSNGSSLQALLQRLGSSPSILYIEPTCVSVTNGNFPGFACVGFGLFLPLDRAEPQLGRLLLQQVKLWQLPRQLRRLCWVQAPASLSSLPRKLSLPTGKTRN